MARGAAGGGGAGMSPILLNRKLVLEEQQTVPDGAGRLCDAIGGIGRVMG